MIVRWIIWVCLTGLCVGYHGSVWAQTNTFPASGRVGIGTLNPAADLHIVNSRATLRIVGNSGRPSWRARLLLDRVDDYRGAGMWVQSSNGIEHDWFWGVPYTGNAFTLGYHSTQPEYKDNALLLVEPNGNVGIGTIDPTAKLAVNGNIKTKEIIVTEQTEGWPDYVFSAEYTLPDLAGLEAFIKRHKHLPDVPTKTEIEEGGQNLGAIQAKLLEKIEELVLIAIGQQKRIEQYKSRLNTVEQILQQHIEKESK